MENKREIIIKIVDEETLHQAVDNIIKEERGVDEVHIKNKI